MKSRAAKNTFFQNKNVLKIKNTLVLNTKVYFFQKQTYVTKIIFSKFLRKM